MTVRCLALDASLGTCSAGLYAGDVGVAEASAPGQAGGLPGLVAGLLTRAGGRGIGLVAATIGPGSFTGIRAGLAFAHGLAGGWGCPIVGVRTDEAMLWAMAEPERVWLTMTSRPGRIFLARDGALCSIAIAELPVPPPGVVLAGPEAGAVAAAFAARGVTVRLAEVRHPTPAAIAAIGARRAAGLLPPLAAEPLYIDAPQARPAAGP